MKNKEIVIGAAQFGTKYGITNKKKFNLLNVKKNIKYFINNNFNTFDTSNLYNSNEVIGKLNNNNEFKFYSKFYVDEVIFNKIKNKNLFLKSYFDDLFCTLNSDNIHCLTFHRFSNLYSNNRIILNYLKYLKKINKIKLIGISILNLDELEKALKNRDIDLIQLPFNVLENRWNKIIKKIYKARANGKIIQVRSIFLQGLLLTSDKKLWSKANCSNPLKIFEWLDNNLKKTKSRNLQSFLINYILSTDWIDSIVIGFNQKAEFKNFVNNLNNRKINKNLLNEIEVNKLHLNEKIINPVKWKI
jgi:aryl-alcohol dehydrogenase-like predicted oxidoreductase